MPLTPGPQLVRSSRNILLRQLSVADQALLEAHVREVMVERGASVMKAGERLDTLFFPDQALLSLEEEVGDGRRLEVGIVGLEGVLGWPLLLGTDRASHTATVQMRPGRLLCLDMEAARAVCARSKTLIASLLKYVGTVLAQMASSVAATLEYALEQRLARFLLMRHDRVAGDLLVLQHQEIADSLNARRASITDRLHILEGEQLIRCKRGRLVIRDRGALEMFAGRSYGTAEASYRTLIAPFGKSVLPA